MKYTSDSAPITPSQARHQVVQTATQRASQVKDTVSQEAGRAIDNVKSAAKEQLDRQRLELSDSLGSVSDALRNTSRRMNDSTLAPQMTRVADAVSSARDFLEQHKVEDVGVALRRLSLRSPVVFYSGLFAVGFLAGRFLTSTDQLVVNEPVLEIDLLQAPPHVEQQTPVAEVVNYRGPY